MNWRNKISVFRNYFDTSPGMESSVGDFCSNVFHGDYAREVEAIRKEQDKKQRDKIKAKLPAATVSGTFSERKKTALIQHSGFISLDIDQKENSHVDSWGKVRDQLAEIENTFFAALSVSGKGVFLVVPIANPAKHEQHFDSLFRDFRKLGLTIDKSCRDVSRLRGISFDPESKINYDAVPYQRIHTPRKKAVPVPRNQSRDDLGELIDEIVRSGVDLTNGYENWFEIGRALANEYGEAGRSYFHQLSQAYSEYKESKCDKQYSACLRSPGKATKGTIFHLAAEHGVYLKNNPVIHRRRVASAGRCKVPASAGFFETNAL